LLLVPFWKGEHLSSTISVARSDPHLSPAVEEIAAPEPELRTTDWTIEPPVNVAATARLNLNHPSLGKRTRRFLVVFFMGVAATLAWQSHGDEIREMIASSYPQLGWLAPQTAAAETVPEIISPTAPATISGSPEFRSLLINLAALKESVDQLAAQFAGGQQQMASEIEKLKAADQGILEKINSALRPAAAPARKPAPVPPPLPADQPSVR